MPTNYEKDRPDVQIQTVPDAFVSTKINFGSIDDTVSRDHYSASEPMDNLRGTHKLLTFDKTSILTSHPDTSANEYKLYLFQESPGVVALYTRQPNNSTPKGYPGFYDGTTVKTINSILANSNGNFTISGTADHITVTASTNEILLDLDGKITDSIKQLVLDVDKHKAEIFKLQEQTKTNTDDIGTLKSGVATNKTDITNLGTRTTALETTTGNHTTELADLERDVIKTLTSRDSTVLVNRSANSVDLSVKGIDPINVKFLISKDATNAIKAGTDNLLFAPPGGSSFDPSVLAGLGLKYGNPALNVNLGTSLQTSQEQQGAIIVKLSKNPNNILSNLSDGLFGAGSGSGAGVSSIDGLTGGVTTATSGVATKIVDTTNNQISFGVTDAVTQAKTLYYDVNKGDDTNPAAGDRYVPLRSLTKCIDLVKTTYVSSDVMGIICVNEQTSFSYTGIPGLVVGEVGRRINSDSTSIVHELTDSFWDYIYTNGRTPKSSVSMYESLGNTNLLFTIDAAANQNTPSKNSFSFSYHSHFFTYSPAQTDYVVQVRAMPTLQEKWASVRSLYVRVDVHEITESFVGGGSPPLPFININCSGFMTDVNHQIDLIFDVNNESLLDLTQGSITRVQFVTVDNYDPAKHAFLNIRINGSSYGQGSKLWDISKIDPHINSYNISTAEFIACSQVVLPTNAIGIQQPPEPITGATRWNISAGLDKPVLEVFSADQWRAPTSGGSSGSGNDDVVETIYYSSTGSNTADGRTPSTAVADINVATVKAIALRGTAGHNSLNPVYITSVGTETNRDIVGNTTAINGQLAYVLPYMNMDGLVVTQSITSAAVSKLNTATYEFNHIHNNGRFIVNIDTTTDQALIKDEFNLLVKCRRLEQDSNISANSFIQIQKSSGTTGTAAVIRTLNVILDVENTEELNVTINDTAEAIVTLNQEGLSGVALHVLYNNRTQDTSGVTQIATKAVPFKITGSPDTNNPCTLSVTATLPEDRSQLYDFSNTVGYSKYNIRLQDKNILNSVVPKEFIIPKPTNTGSVTPAALSINGDLVTYNTVQQTPVQKVIATQDYVNNQIANSKVKSSVASQEAVRFVSYIRIDPLSQTMLIPNTTFSCGGQNYPDQTSIDLTDTSFTVQEEVFSFRLNDITSGTKTLPKQVQLDQWTGAGTGQTKAFYGIGRIKLLDNTVVTVTDNTANTTEIEYNVAFTSTILSLADLQANLLPGTWFELSGTDNKYVVGVISGAVVAGTGASNYIVKANICFTNSKRQAELYTLSNLSSKTVNMYLSPWPAVFPAEMKRFRSTVTDADLCHVQMHFYLSAYHSSDVVEEALLLTPYSASYAAYANRATDTTWHQNIGKYQFSIGGAIPKIIIEKFKTVWAESAIKVGYMPIAIPSVTTDNSTSGRRITGLIIKDSGTNLETSCMYSATATNPLYFNQAAYFSGLTNLGVTNQKIACGLQLSSYADGCFMVTRIGFSKADLDAVQLFAPTDSVSAGTVLSSFSSTATYQSALASKAFVYDEYANRNIAAYSLATANAIKPFSNILGSTKAASAMTMFILGTSMPNSLYSAISNHRIVNLDEPDAPIPVPSNDEILLIGNYTDAEVQNSPNKGLFIKNDGTAVGNLVNT